MYRLLCIVVIISCLTQACNPDNKLEEDISKMDIKLKIERFDREFAVTNASNLQTLKTAYPFMFSSQYHDSVWIAKTTDVFQQQLNVQVAKVHGDLSDKNEEIIGLFQHLKYYFKEFREPRVITFISDVDYRNKTIVTDSIVLVAIDTYLGADNELYDRIYDYIKQNLKPSQIVPDLAEQYARKRIFQSQRKSLLDEMIYSGKILYFKDIMLPSIPDEEKIGYSKADLEWAQINESNIWSHFVEHELLFSTNVKLAERFINPAPFSKFNLDLDAESPGRLGQYIGWQIVRAYAKNNKVSIQDILGIDAEEIFNNSRFKPRK